MRVHLGLEIVMTWFDSVFSLWLELVARMVQGTYATPAPAAKKRKRWKNTGPRGYERIRA